MNSVSERFLQAKALAISEILDYFGLESFILSTIDFSDWTCEYIPVKRTSNLNAGTVCRVISELILEKQIEGNLFFFLLPDIFLYYEV